jgi:hypothetical protein
MFAKKKEVQSCRVPQLGVPKSRRKPTTNQAPDLRDENENDNLRFFEIVFEFFFRFLCLNENNNGKNNRKRKRK